jgi:hypothetical protein
MQYTENQAKQRLITAKKAGELTHLNTNTHGSVVMSIRGGYMKFYTGYTEALEHYERYKKAIN